jgi:hypothetical protein
LSSSQLRIVVLEMMRRLHNSAPIALLRRADAWDASLSTDRAAPVTLDALDACGVTNKARPVLRHASGASRVRRERPSDRSEAPAGSD